MAVLTFSFFLYLVRKTASLIQTVWATVVFVFIMISAEARFFGEKYNGIDALLIMVPFAVFGIMGGIWFWKSSKAYPFVIAWYVWWFIIRNGNRLSFE